jgi:DNA-binding NarL/FixJ family response regulator
VKVQASNPTRVLLLLGADDPLLARARNAARVLDAHVATLATVPGFSKDATGALARLVLVDGLAAQDGLAALIQEARALPTCPPVVVYLSQIRPDLIAKARQAGAARVLMRDEVEMEMVTLLRASL